MRNILLVNPDLRFEEGQINLPLPLLYLGSYLNPEKYECVILDYNNYPEPARFYTDLSRELSKNPLCVGISAMTVQVKNGIEIARFVRERDAEIPLVWGGIHPTLFPDQTAASPWVDYLVVGEGEKTFLDLVESLDAGRRPTAKVLQGENVDMAEVPPINWELLDTVKKLGFPRVAAVTSIPLQATRGCPFKCTFCYDTVSGRRYRGRPLSAVVAELKTIIEAGAKDIVFVDELFFSHRRRLEQFFDLLERERLRLSWFGNMRADALRRKTITPESLERAKACGLTTVGTGVESGSERILKMLNKLITVPDVLETARQLERTGIRAQFSYMFGLPGETWEDFLQTVELMYQVNALAPSTVYQIMPQFFRPYPGSTLYLRCLEAGLREPQSLEEWAKMAHLLSDLRPVKGESYPWVLFDIEKAETVIFYTQRATLPTFVMGKSRLRKAIRWVARLRLRFRFFRFPLEMHLFWFFRRLLQGTRLVH